MVELALRGRSGAFGLAFLQGFLVSTAAAWASTASTPDQNAEAFDPILDGGRDDGVIEAQRLEPPKLRAPGFVFTGQGGFYAGRVRSFIQEGRSGLSNAIRPHMGFGFGARTPSRLEIAADLSLGIGLTYDNLRQGNRGTFDLIIEPKALWHVSDPDPWGLYVGGAAPFYLFDVELSGLNQAGVGPGVIVGGNRRIDDHSLLFIEASFVYLYDFLAYETVYPSAEDRALDPSIEPHRDEGAWFPIVRVSVGYRLVGF